MIFATIKKLLRRQDGTAMLLVIAFIALSVPIVTAGLAMAGTVSVDSKVKTDIVKRQYSSVGCRIYVQYLLDNPRVWQAWLAEHGGSQTITINGEDVPCTIADLPTLSCHTCMLVTNPDGSTYIICADKEDTAYPSIPAIWPPNGDMKMVEILGVTPPPGETVAITVTRIYQDEHPVNAPGTGNTFPDGWVDDADPSIAWIRAERAGPGDGRVYHITYNAVASGGDACTGEVNISVHDMGTGSEALDSGPPWWDSTTGEIIED